MKISNLEQLQELYGEPHPATAEKNLRRSSKNQSTL